MTFALLASEDAQERRLGGEAAAGQLHPVTRVAREADDDRFELLYGLGQLVSDPTSGCRSRPVDETSTVKP